MIARILRSPNLDENGRLHEPRNTRDHELASGHRDDGSLPSSFACSARLANKDCVGGSLLLPSALKTFSHEVERNALISEVPFEVALEYHVISGSFKGHFITVYTS